MKGNDVGPTEDAPLETATLSGDTAILARRYASALYELAVEQKCLEAVVNDLRTLKPLADNNHDFRDVVYNPRLKREVLMETMQHVATAGKLHRLTGNFLGLLARHRRLSSLPAILESFLAAHALRRGELTANVTSARPLSASQQEQLAQSLSAFGGGKVQLLLREDKNLLGGIVVKMGSRLIDASLRGKLEKMERQLRTPVTTTQKGAA